MKPVVIRCPNCGTTQRELGECEACHEAEVRWYCPNHAPGRWIDGPECDACGARFGVEAPPASGPISTPPAARRPVDWRPPARGGTPGAPRRGTPSGRPPRRPAELDDPVRAEPRDAGELDPRVVERMDPMFEEWLDHLRRSGGTGRGAERPFPTVDPAAVARGVAGRALGCVARLVIAFIVLAIIGYFVLGAVLGGYADDEGREIPVDLAPVTVPTATP